MQHYTSAVLKNGEPVSELRFGNSNSRALDEKTGEFNAHSQKELLQSISNLMAECARGNVIAGVPAAQHRAGREDRRTALAAALNSDSEWKSLGAGLATRITETRSRDSFMRRLCIGDTLKGGLPMVTVTMYDTVSIVANNSTDLGFQTIRNKTFHPTEFEMNTHVRVDAIEMAQLGADILDDAFNQGLDATGVAEDRMWKRAADASVGVVNPMTYIAGELSSRSLAKLRSTVSDWNLPVTNCVIANDFWSDIIGSNDFASFLDPVTKYDLALNGYLGTLIGLNLTTDAFRVPTQKVLDKGEIFVVAAPEHHACYTDRGGVSSKPTDGANDGNSGRGWFFNQILSFVLANPRSVAKGKRI